MLESKGEVLLTCVRLEVVEERAKQSSARGHLG